MEARLRHALTEWQAARKALENLEQAARGDDPQARESALAEARERMEQAAAQFEQLAVDFPLYDLEKEAQPLLQRWPTPCAIRQTA